MSVKTGDQQAMPKTRAVFVGATVNGHRSASASRSDAKDRRQLTWWLVWIVGIFLVLAALAPHLAHWSVDYSEPVRAQVTESHFDQGVGWLAPLTGRAVFSYRYVHQGQLFAGSAYRAGGGQAAAVKRFMPGAMITVYIDPARPERALVQPGLSRPEAGRILLGLIALLIASVRLATLSRENNP